MERSFISVSRIAWLVGVAILVLIANVAASVLYMVIFSYLIDPGHDPAYYEAHVQRAAPYSSIIAGFPLMFLAGWWVGRWWQGTFPIRSAIVIWLAYAVIDLAIIIAAGATTQGWQLVAVSLVTKLASVYAGARFALGSESA